MKFPACIIVLITAPLFLHAQSTEDSAEKNWSTLLETDYYFIPELEIHPTISAYIDHKSLHFEARYNYEDFNTASVFGGYTWQKNGDFSYALTPITGIAIGKTNGVLPGVECTASYSILNFYSENEYMLSFKGKEDNFFYSWTQLSVPVVKKLALGISTESLRLYKTKFDVQKGVYAEYSPGNFLVDVYFFNPFSKYNYAVASVSYQF